MGVLNPVVVDSRAADRSGPAGGVAGRVGLQDVVELADAVRYQPVPAHPAGDGAAQPLAQVASIVGAVELHGDAAQGRAFVAHIPLVDPSGEGLQMDQIRVDVLPLRPGIPTIFPGHQIGQVVVRSHHRMAFPTAECGDRLPIIQQCPVAAHPAPIDVVVVGAVLVLPHDQVLVGSQLVGHIGALVVIALPGDAEVGSGQRSVAADSLAVDVPVVPPTPAMVFPHHQELIAGTVVGQARLQQVIFPTGDGDLAAWQPAVAADPVAADVVGSAA